MKYQRLHISVNDREAAIERAHHLRSRALRDMVGNMFKARTKDDAGIIQGAPQAQ